MNKFKIVVSTTSFSMYDATSLELCKKKGYQVTLNPHGRKVTPEELIELSKDAVGLIAGTETLNKSVLMQLPKLKVISRCGVGIDNVDLDTATRLGIKVFNTPDAPTLAVAELTVGLMIALLRKVPRMDGGIRKDRWDKQMGNLLSGKNVGIIGFGRIGQKVAELLRGFCVNLAYYDIESITCSPECISKGMQELLCWADIVTLHLSASPSGGTLIGEKELKQMKYNSWLINVSRGGVVDEKALFDALKCGHLNGCALDVFESEPYTGPLKNLEQVILTPHVGSYAREARIEMELKAVKNLIAGLECI